MSWLVFALLAALFAALTTILAKLGLDNVSSYLATAIRTAVVLLLSWGIVFALGQHRELGRLTARNWLFLILSGIATGLSWVFYYRALQAGDASRVAPVDKLSVVFTIVLAFLILGEPVSPRTVAGGLLVGAGVLVLAFP